MTIYNRAAQRPHRKELKVGITDDIIKLLNETAETVEEGLFREMGLYNKNMMKADVHTKESGDHTAKKTFCALVNSCIFHTKKMFAIVYLDA